jgi:hypothetical protein
MLSYWLLMPADKHYKSFDLRFPTGKDLAREPVVRPNERPEWSDLGVRIAQRQAWFQ